MKCGSKSDIAFEKTVSFVAGKFSFSLRVDFIVFSLNDIKDMVLAPCKKAVKEKKVILKVLGN